MFLRFLLVSLCLVSGSPSTSAQTAPPVSKQPLQVETRNADRNSARANAELELERYRKEPNPEPEKLARILNRVAIAAFENDELSLARQLYDEAIEVLNRAGLNQSLHAATVLQNLAVLSENGGDYASAIGHRRKSLAIKQEKLGSEHADIATIMMELASSLVSIGQQEEAATFNLKALDICIKEFGSDGLETAEALVEVCQDCVNLGDYKNARSFGAKALKIQEASLERTHPDLARTYSMLGILESRLEDFEAARTYFEKSLTIYRSVKGNDHPMVGQVLIHLGQVLRLEGKFESAVAVFQQSASILERSRGASHPDVAVPCYGIAESAFLMQDFPTAFAACDQARRITRQHFASVLPYLPEKEILTFIDDEDTLRFAEIMSASQLLLGDDKIAELSATWALNHKGMAQVALADQNRMLSRITDPKQAKQRDALQRSRQQLAQLSLVSSEGFDATKIKGQREILTRTIDALVRELTLGQATTNSESPWVEMNDLRRSLAQDTYAIQFIRFDRYLFQGETDWGPAHYLAWSIPPAGLDKVRMFDLGPAEPIDQLVDAIRKDIAMASGPKGTIGNDGEEKVTSQIQSRMSALGKKIFSPIAPYVRPAKHLVLSPDGALWLTPWAALPAENGTQYLIEKLALSFAVSPRELGRAKSTTNKIQPPIIFANPKFDLAPESVWNSIRDVLQSKAPDKLDRERSFKPASIHRFANVLPLPNTAIEAELISPSLERYTGLAPQRFLDQYALETVVKTVSKPSVLAFGTHGFFLEDATRNVAGNKSKENKANQADDRNPLLRCGLLLAGCKDSNAGTGTAGDDGVLTGMEIVGLQLEGTELVVLSACETAVGSVRNGEGVASLCQAFQLAGANSVVATLWTVPDRDTALLINKFMEELAAGKSKPEALRAAQIDRIQKRRERYGAAHPYFWSAVTISGR
jgi:CHAT domain-containing protein/tetratricopeptide (TPR) repeat protein